MTNPVARLAALLREKFECHYKHGGSALEMSEQDAAVILEVVARGRPEGPSAPPSQNAIEAAMHAFASAKNERGAMGALLAGHFRHGIIAAIHAAYAVDFGSRTPDPQESPNE